MRNKKNYILLVVVVIIGVVVYKNMKSQQPPSTSVQEVKQNKELVLENLGIKFKKPKGLEDLLFLEQSNSRATFTSQRIASQDENCTAEDGPLGSFTKISKEETKNDSSGNWRRNNKTLKEMAKETPPQAKEFENFYILYEGPQATCSDDEDVNNLQASQAKLLQSVVLSIEDL